MHSSINFLFCGTFTFYVADATTAGRGYWIRTSGGEHPLRSLANFWIKPLSQSSINDKLRQHTPLSCHCGLQLVSEPVVGFFPPRNVGRFGELSFSYKERMSHVILYIDAYFQRTALSRSIPVRIFAVNNLMFISRHSL